MIDGASKHCGTEAQVERLYWREEELWIRVRTLEGKWLSLPCRETDLPRVTAEAFPKHPYLSPQVLLALARYLKRYGQRHSNPVRKKA